MSILSLDTDIRPYFGSKCCDEHGALLLKLLDITESQAKQWVGHGIAQATYTNEYHPRWDLGVGGGYDQVDVVGGQAVFGQTDSVQEGHVLQLDNLFVTAISELREDTGARFASSGGFAAATELTEGKDFDLQREHGDYSKSGRVLKRYGNWSSTPGTIRVTYTAGLTAAQLRGDFMFVKGALLDDLRLKFNYQRSQQQAAGFTGPIRKEEYVGDYKVEYESGQQSGANSSAVMSELTPLAKSRLQPIWRVKL